MPILRRAQSGEYHSRRGRQAAGENSEGEGQLVALESDCPVRGRAHQEGRSERA